jgi:sterol desaturase/sphingolipid hydroxylase (fatty acid hydroxylase superfamily)
MDPGVHSETIVRIVCFVAVFAGIGLWEVIAPRRARSTTRLARWPANLGIVVLNTALVRILVPAAAVGLAVTAQEQQWGLLNQMPLPDWTAVVVGVVVFDLIIYAQHVVLHAVPALWRLHRMHHADLDFDVTTGVRFHPLEILVSLAIKLAFVAALGIPPVAVLIFEVLLNATSMFNHGNIGIPTGIDRVLRRMLVTPDMHRVHHSVVAEELNSNFGFILPWWDRLFRTYRAQPAAGHQAMTVGIEQFRTPEDLRLDRMLIQPFRA